MADIMYPEYQTLDIKVDLENPEEDIKRVVQHLRPTWPQEQVVCKPMEHGYKALNLVYVCTTKTDTENKDALIVKLVKELDHHPCPKDNDRELHNWLQLNKHKVGVPLLARFKNGLVQKFMPGSLLNLELSNDPHISRLVAEELAKFHEAARGSDLYVDKSCGPGDMGWMDPINRSTMSNLKELEAKGEHSDVLSQFISVDEMINDIETMKERLKQENMELVLCHNDCWRENILYDKQSDKLAIIDYEILDRNYAAFDLGIYISTCADNPPEISKQPSETFSRDFIATYLAKRNQLQGKNEQVTPEEINTYYRQACLCIPVVNMVISLHTISLFFVVFTGRNEVLAKFRSLKIAAFLLYFYLLNKTPFGWKLTRGFYEYYLDSKARFWPK